MTPALAELRDVSKSFRGRPALVDVSFDVGPGVTALLGPNGAGKTTAVRMLLGLRRPDAGEVRLFGEDPRTAAPRRRCGATPQETDVPGTLRVREIVDFVRAHYARPVGRVELLERFGLLELADRQAGGLSTGQRRRLALALAFAGDPELVVLDEPTVSLDREARRSAWETIAALGDGRGVLLTTHDLREAEALATRVVVLEAGRVVLDAPTDEVGGRADHAAVRLRRQRLPALRNELRRSETADTLTLLTARPDALLRELVSLRADLEGLTVTRLSLEEALDAEGRA